LDIQNGFFYNLTKTLKKLLSQYYFILCKKNNTFGTSLNKNYMKKTLLKFTNQLLVHPKLLASTCFAGLLLLSLSGFSQTPKFYNSTAGNSSNTFPLANSTNRVQWIYDAGIFRTGGTSGTAAGSGNITKVYFRLGSSASSSTSYSNYTISLGQVVGTTSTWSSTTWATGLTQCFYQSTFSMSGATANNWYGITLQTPFSYDPSKSLVFEIKVSSTSGSNYVSQVTTGGNKRIWGTYSGGSGTSYGSGLVDFGFDLVTAPNDAGITKLNTPINPCGQTSDPVTISITNFGTNAIGANSAVAIIAQLSGVTSGNFTKVFNRSLAVGASDTIHITNLNTAAMNGNLNVKSWARWSADTVYKNDTNYTSLSISGTPDAPKPKDVIKCGQGSVKLNAGVPSNTTALWYNSSTSTTALGLDSIFNTPFQYGGTVTYYVESARLGNTKTITTGITAGGSWFGGGVQSGNMFNVTANKTLIIDSLSLNINNFNTITVNVYVKTGTFAGSQTNPSAWTLIRTVSGIVAKGIGNRTTFSMGGYTMPAGSFAVYVQVSEGIIFNSGAQSFSNTDLTIQGGDAISGNFAGTATNYTWSGNVYYRTLCTGPRVAVNSTVKPSPHGGSFIKGSPFTTTQPNTLGTASNPDIVASNDKLTYEVTPPTGYINADHGSTWTASNFTLRTKSGRVLPNSYYTFSAPSGAGNGKITFSPDSLITDTSLIMTLSLRDLGPHYCDSTLTRYIFIAPRPVPNFKFNSPICDGDAVLFTDLSKISSGNIAYSWDFNTGNPADTSNLSDVVFTFPTYGTYDVTLTTTSMPYGYVIKKTISVVVTEIPKISFNVLNACEKVAVSFKNNTTYSGTSTVSYIWDFGDPSTTLDKSTAKNPTWTYTNAGGYRVRVIASVNGCSAELSKNANQFAVPTAKFTAPGLICDKSDVQFTNGSTIKMGNMGYTWDFGDGGVSNFANPIHQFANATTKQVKMKAVSEFGCVDSMIKTITLSEAPKPDFTWGAACNLTNTNFTFTGTKPSGALTTFNWNFAGEGSTTLENPSKLFSITGRKNVTLTMVSNNGCSNSITKEVNVKLQSKADFISGDVCEDDDAVFTNKSTVSQGNLIYNWKFGDATTSGSQSPRHRYNIGGISQTYNVTLVAVVPGGCSDSISKQVSVNAKPKSDFTFTTSGRQVSFAATQAGNTLYQWRFGDGGSSNSATTKYDYLNFASGKYQACLAVVNAAGCFSETCKAISISGGVDKLNKLSGVKIYPNPNKGAFTVTVEDPKSDIAIGVYNLLGEVVKTVETTSLKSTYSIDLNVANGVYLVKVTNGGLTSTQKVTINK
jgi:PKD repeat protein